MKKTSKAAKAAATRGKPLGFTYYGCTHYELSDHGKQRLRERGVKLADVLYAMRHATRRHLRANRPNERVCCRNADGSELHVVYCISCPLVTIVSVYYQNRS